MLGVSGLHFPRLRVRQADPRHARTVVARKEQAENSHIFPTKVCTRAPKSGREIKPRTWAAFLNDPPAPQGWASHILQIIVTSRVLPRFIQSTSRYEVRHVRDGGAPAARAQAVADASAIRAERRGAGGWLWVGIGGGWGLLGWGRNGVWVRTQKDDWDLHKSLRGPSPF